MPINACKLETRAGDFAGWVLIDSTTDYPVQMMPVINGDNGDLIAEALFSFWHPQDIRDIQHPRDAYQAFLARTVSSVAHGDIQDVKTVPANSQLTIAMRADEDLVVIDWDRASVFTIQSGPNAVSEIAEKTVTVPVGDIQALISAANRKFSLTPAP